MKMLMMPFLDFYSKLLIFSLFSFAVSEQEINVRDWETNPIAGDIEPIIFDKIINTNTKVTCDIKNFNQPLNVNIYSMIYRNIQKLIHPGDKVRCTEIIFSWVPLGSDMGGLITMLLVDKRQNGASRIKGQVSYKPDRATVAIFYQNYFVSIDDVKYLDFEVIVNGINMEIGKFGEISLYWKTYVGKPNIYKKRDPIVFYLDPESLPEEEINDSRAIMKRFAQKAKNRRSKELEYFKNIQNFIDINKKPINFASADLTEAYDTINRKKQLANQYVRELETNKPKSESIIELRSALELIRERESELESELLERINLSKANDREIELYKIMKEKPEPKCLDEEYDKAIYV